MNHLSTETDVCTECGSFTTKDLKDYKYIINVHLTATGKSFQLSTLINEATKPYKKTKICEISCKQNTDHNTSTSFRKIPDIFFVNIKRHIVYLYEEGGKRRVHIIKNNAEVIVPEKFIFQGNIMCLFILFFWNFYVTLISKFLCTYTLL